MGSKRHLGLGKASKAKKQKQQDTKEKEAEDSSNGESKQLTVELSEEVDPDDDLAQLKALWKTAQSSEEKDQLIYNGIIHECDRLLREHAAQENGDKEQESSNKKITLPDFFHSIYALALVELAVFESEDKQNVSDLFDAALERIELGFEKHDSSIDLLLAQSKILLDQISLQFVRNLEVSSEVGESLPDLSTILDKALNSYEKAEEKSQKIQKDAFYGSKMLEVLDTLDSLLQIIDDFGEDKVEADESDDEEDEDVPKVELSKKHPLFNIRNNEKYDSWWRNHTITLFDYIEKQLTDEGVNLTSLSTDTHTLLKEKKADENEKLALRREVSKSLGQSYLQEAETPSNIFTALTYDDEYADYKELDGLSKESSREISIDLLTTALKYLKLAQDKDEPDSWVAVAECLISLGNLYELDSKEQEDHYTQAEKILETANNVTNGKYDSILENLQAN